MTYYALSLHSLWGSSVSTVPSPNTPPVPRAERSRYGILFVGDDHDSWMRYVSAAERLGFDALGIGDSPSIYPDVYMRATVAASIAPRLRIGPLVTNPLLRHPVVTATAAATLDQLTPDRTFLAIGTGDSAAVNAGARPGSLGQLETYVQCVRDLLTRGVATWEGRTTRSSLTSDQIPIYVAASGPRTLQAAGRIGDGVVVGSGISPDFVDYALTNIEAGATSAGRTLDDLDVWFLAHVSLAETDEAAMSAIKNSLVTKVHATYKTPATLDLLPPFLRSAAQDVLARYDGMQHAAFSSPYHASLADEHPELMRYVANRHAVTGSPEVFTERLHEIRAAGVRNLWMNPRTADKETFIDLWARQVRGALNIDHAD